MASELPHAPGMGEDFWTHGLDRAFFSRVYLRGAQLGVAAAMLCLCFEQKPAAVGLLSGGVVGLFSLWTVEATVRLLFNGGRHAGLKLGLAAMLKLPFVLAALVAVAWAGQQGFVNVFAVLGGVLLVHATILVMVIGAAMAHQHNNNERYQ
jgi:hypothetical protein